MLLKHQPAEIDPSAGEKLEKKAHEVIAQMPKINQLEKELEIQDVDAEITLIQKQMEKSVKETKQRLAEVNK